MRVVFDTNVIVSGLLWKGSTKTLFDYVERGKLTLCLTPKIILEIERVLRYQKILKQLQAASVDPQEIVMYLLEHAIVFEDAVIVKAVAADPSDDVFLNCACQTEVEMSSFQGS